MERVIKFRRAHFDHEGKFIRFSYWGKDIDANGNPCERTFLGPSSISGTDKVVDDQFIGSIGGQEIYLGDILDDNGVPTVVKMGNIQKRIYMGQGNCTHTYSLDLFSGYGRGADELYVIGNIYENSI